MAYKITQADRLFFMLHTQQWADSFSLYRALYGTAPCGRLSARIYDLKRRGHTIERETEMEHCGKIEKRGRVWYRMARIAG